MFWTPKIRAVLSTIIAFSLSSQPLFAQALAQPSLARATVTRTLIQRDQAEAIYRRLVEVHWTPRTGLFRSFPDSVDLKLSQQSATYEQAAMGLLAIRFGDLERARSLSLFFFLSLLRAGEREDSTADETWTSLSALSLPLSLSPSLPPSLCETSTSGECSRS